MAQRFESAFPNIFYDLIVFISPSVLLVVGLVVGLGGWPFVRMGGAQIDLGATDIFIVLVALLLLGYEYGRLAETLSSPFVAGLLRFLASKDLFFRNPDFNALLTREVDALPHSDILEQERKGSKWTIYFFAALIAPDIGRDLLKRYAWEKLSRSSAMTFCFLFLFSFVFFVIRSLGWTHEIFGNWGFGSLSYTIVTALLTVATYYEYYQRNAWNNDLLSKTLPVLLYAAKLRLNRSSADSEQ